MKFSRKAKAHWNGSGKEGKGNLTTQSQVLEATPYSFHTRFEDGKGTNPEELIAAAHAGCFTMKLSFLLGEEGFVPGDLNTEASVTFEDGAISGIHLTLRAKVDGMEADAFQAVAKKAKETCPISMLLDAPISLDASLV